MSSYSTPDFYSKKAKQEGYLARSVYKLQEIDEKYRIFKAGQKILDLGASPGSWSQYALKKVGLKGKVVGIDLKDSDVSPCPNYHFIRGNILESQKQFLQWKNFDVIMSDMAPNTTGIKSQDTFFSHELSFMALETAKYLLTPQGVFLCKIFEGEDIQDFYTELKKTFRKFKSLKPKAVRKNSKELYIIAWILKNPVVSEEISS